MRVSPLTPFQPCFSFSYIGACAGLANTHKYWLLVVLRVVQAAGSSSVIAIGAGSIGDIAPPSERGLFMSIFGLGYVPLPSSNLATVLKADRTGYAHVCTAQTDGWVRNPVA
jgi:MFS family permease